MEDSDDYLSVATTRPETLFGDTAVAVNPSDDRYKDLIGKKVKLPLVNKLIPIIGDVHADPEFGTGVVKITPAHDPNDFEVGNRHNLDRIIVMNPDGTMNENAFKYASMDRFACREAVVKDLEELGLLIKVEKIVHAVGHSERTDVMVEPYLSKQWFVKMRPLADRVLLNQKNKDTKVNFVPERFEKIMNHWMEITYDWCISRQLWWGHRIPAWYRGEEVYVGVNPPDSFGWVQDSDVLDTWFSSALWPFSTLGWPNMTDLLKRHYPNDVLVTGYDIIPFWVNRMTFQGLHFTNERPFKDCLIHGLIRDKNGRKMSKSLGNGVDPMDVIDKYGADSLRFFLATSSASGQDLRYDEEKVKSTWNFINKLWNASRFCLMNISSLKEVNFDNLNMSDKWILTKYEKVVKDVRRYMDKYEFNNVGSIIYSFVWNDFCDNYIEMAKFSSDTDATKSTLYYVLMGIIKMLHPFMPYVTEEIYQNLPFKDNDSIMISTYPKYDLNLVFEQDAKVIDNLIEFVANFRNVKQENNIGKNFKVKINNDSDYTLIKKMLKLDDNIIDTELNITKYEVISGIYNITLYYEKEETEEDLIFKKKQCENLEKSIARRRNLLNNPSYVSKAPSHLVSEEREKLKKEEEELAKLIG